MSGDYLRETENFSAAELACKCGECTYIGMDRIFLTMLQEVREAYGKPLVVTSGYRCPDHNASVSSTGRNGPHTTRRAVDISLLGVPAILFLATVLHYRYTENGARYVFTGFGVNQRGPHEGRFIHLDNLLNEDTSGPRPWIWTY